MSSSRRTATTIALVAALLAAPAAGSAQAPPRLPSVTLPAGLDRVLRDYEAAWTAGDAAALAALFTEDGFVSNRNGWIRGREAILQEYARAGGPLQLRALEWSVDGDTGWIVGAYGYPPTFAETDGGRFVLALRRGTDGRWLIAADLDNTNRPPGG